MARDDVLDRLIQEFADVKARLRHLELAEPETPSCVLRRTSNQTIAHSAAFTLLEWTSETRDRSGMHDPATNPERITVAHAGLYFVAGWFAWAVNATGVRGIAIYQNTVRRKRDQRKADDGTFLGSSVLIWAAAGDYFTLGALQTSGGNLDVVYSSESPWFGAFKVVGG